MPSDSEAVTSFNGRVKADGSGPFPAEKGRYHLYVCSGCPFAHRTIIVRKLKGLEDVISMDYTHWYVGENGWMFDETEEDCTKDSINGFKYLKEVYDQTNSNYSGSCSVPVLYDKKNKKIVNNESTEIMDILNNEFNEFCPTEQQKELNLYPAEHQKTIKELFAWVDPNVIQGVYDAGMASDQESYEKKVDIVFNSLDKLEAILSKQRYLTGNKMTLADIWTFTSLVRFDYAYYTVFKCNIKRITDYPNLWGFVRDIYHTSGIGETVYPDQIKKCYYLSDRGKGPTGTFGKGPIIDYSAAHGRETLA